MVDKPLSLQELFGRLDELEGDLPNNIYIQAREIRKLQNLHPIDV